MSDETRELKLELRDAQSKITSVESALTAVKGQRVRLAVWSAIGGFLLFAVGGQWFPGYQLDSTAAEASQKNAAEAVSSVMSELCAERFMRPAGFEARLAGLQEATGDWNKATYIRDGAWAETPDGQRPDHATSEKCVSAISERISGESGKPS